jgi:hypothetical protein
VLGDSLARSAQPQMSARHANGRDSICCDSVGCSSICADCVFNDLTRLALAASGSRPRHSTVGRFANYRWFGGRLFDAQLVGGPGFVCDLDYSGGDVIETSSAVDRASDCVDVSANDRRFNQPSPVSLGASLSAASLFMTFSLGTSCSTTSALFSSRLSSSRLSSSRLPSSTRHHLELLS